ncbi:helix-turn-helix domain-containing protein [Leucobacter sp. NPDC058333]|uniref:helix-turn-helix domain-containing protein n=1 Tax=Leucobacter sp. NPDC058333 TaxID=3346450 RepID=UPI003665B153
MRAIHPTADLDPIRIGAKLRSSRLAQGLTLEQLAQATGLTKGFISRIERNDTMPSVPTLVQLCQALSLPIGNLFEEPELQLISLEAAPAINMGGTGADERLITPRSEDRVQVLRSSLEPNASGGDQLYTVNCNLESLHVVSGELDIQFADRQVSLSPGDTLTFPGRTPHTWRAGAHGAEAVWVLVPAAWSGSA